MKKGKKMKLMSFTRHGMGTLMAFYKKLGCTVLTEPTEVKDGSNRWTIEVTHPFPEDQK